MKLQPLLCKIHHTLSVEFRKESEASLEDLASVTLAVFKSATHLEALMHI